jgi:hypothetical protein
VISLLELPPEMQRLVYEKVALRDLARLACVSKDIHAAYLERVDARDVIVADHLERHFTPEFRDGLSPSQTALPCDLIVHPPVRRPSLCSLHDVQVWTIYDVQVCSNCKDYLYDLYYLYHFHVDGRTCHTG